MRVPAVRRVSATGLLAFLCFATCGLGLPIGGENGKLAISNLGPLLFVILVAPSFMAAVKTIRKPSVGFFLLFNACALLSFALFMFRFGWNPNAPVLLFQDVEFIFVLLLVWYARHRFDEFFRVARLGIICMGVLAIWYGVGQSHNPGLAKLVLLTFGMDDKSQAAVLFCCMSYILLRYYNDLFSRLVAGGLFAMSMMTLSRLPVIFLPALLITLSVRTRYGWILTAFTVIGVSAAFIAFGDALTTVFKALDRLSSVGQVAGDNATSAHIYLIKAALEMKFDDLEVLIFGSGPGNFSKALTSFPLDIHELEALDPQLVADARVGRAPMHSTPISMLLDYNIVVFGLLIFLGLRGVHYLLKKNLNLDLIFFTTLFTASMFYSLHNKPYFFLAVATVAIGAMGPAPAADSVADSLPHHPQLEPPLLLEEHNT
jgi:hypothetical protein